MSITSGDRIQGTEVRGDEEVGRCGGDRKRGAFAGDRIQVTGEK